MRDKIYEAYTKISLEKEKAPTSVYRFCKKIEIEESEFYKHFPLWNMWQMKFSVSFLKMQ